MEIKSKKKIDEKRVIIKSNVIASMNPKSNYTLYPPKQNLFERFLQFLNRTLSLMIVVSSICLMLLILDIDIDKVMAFHQECRSSRIYHVLTVIYQVLYIDIIVIKTVKLISKSFYYPYLSQRITTMKLVIENFMMSDFMSQDFWDELLNYISCVWNDWRLAILQVNLTEFYHQIILQLNDLWRDLLTKRLICI